MIEQKPAANEVELTTERGMMRGTTQPMMAVRPEPEGVEMEPAVKPRSYHPTRWPIVNRSLDIADALTGGRAGILQRVVNYLMFGGFAAVVNLVLVTVIYYYVALPVSQRMHYAIAFVVATEVSIMTNFIPQDLVTFRHLPGHSRSWLARCLRFHMTSVGGVIVTAIVSFTLHEIVGIHLTIAQAIAIIVALSFNFTFHHIFTYRHVHQEAL
jgi:putative flippase GtrA